MLRTEVTIYSKELNKTRIILTVYYLLLIYRTFQILSSYYYYQGFSLTSDWTIALLFSSLLILMLIRRFWVIPLLIAFLQVKFDSYFSTGTIGSTVTIFINYYFAAYYFSIKCFNSNKNIDYFEFNHKVSNYKFLLAFLWSITNLYSLRAHLNDSHWINGTAFGVMLCNSFISPHFKTFRNLYLSNPDVYFVISKFLSYTFILIQAIMLPALFIKKTRYFFYICMLIYLIGITFIVDVSFLAHFAWLLFFLLLPQFYLSDKKINIQKNALQLCPSLPKLNKTFFIIIAIFVLLNTPIIDIAVKKPIWLFREWDTYQFVNKKLGQLGLGKANLFNSYILDGGNKWFVIYKLERKNWELVPIMDTSGKKLNYRKDWLHTTNHGSDFLWLANTYQYAMGQEYVAYSTYIYIRLIRFDFNKYRTSTCYKVCFYSNKKVENNPYVATLDSTVLFSASLTSPVKRKEKLN